MAYRELPLPGGPAPHVACPWTRDPEPRASVRRILPPPRAPCPGPRAPEPRASVRRILPDACVDVVWVQGDRLVVAGPATGPALAAVPAGGGGGRGGGWGPAQRG